MDKKLLGRRINAARKERGWTSERLSEICNINATYLRQIESGAKTPSLQVFVALCEALKVSPTYLRTVFRARNLRIWTRCLRSAARQRRSSST